MNKSGVYLHCKIESKNKHDNKCVDDTQSLLPGSQVLLSKENLQELALSVSVLYSLSTLCLGLVGAWHISVD